MAEAMLGLKRTHRCTEVTTSDIGNKVTVMGWVQKSRNKGGIIFVDLETVPVSYSLFLRKKTAAQRILQKLRS